MQIQISHCYLLFNAAGALWSTKATSGAKAIIKCAHIHTYTNSQCDSCAKYRKKSNFLLIVFTRPWGQKQSNKVVIFRFIWKQAGPMTLKSKQTNKKRNAAWHSSPSSVFLMKKMANYYKSIIVFIIYNIKARAINSQRTAEDLCPWIICTLWQGKSVLHLYKNTFNI